jgi:hypothetical protein
MTTYQLFQRLPAYLTIHYQGKVYTDCAPAIIGSGDKMMICYINRQITVLLWERIGSEQELNEYLKESADKLEGATEYEPIYLFFNS